MKIIRHILLVIIVLVFAVSVVMNLMLFLFVGGFNSPSPFLSGAHIIVFIASIFCFLTYLNIAQGKALASPLKEVLVTTGALIFSLAPIIFLVNAQIQSDKMHSNQEKTCRNVEIGRFQYRLCSGGPEAFGPSVSPINLPPERGSYDEAMRVWDEKGWEQFGEGGEV